MFPLKETPYNRSYPLVREFYTTTAHPAITTTSSPVIATSTISPVYSSPVLVVVSSMASSFSNLTNVVLNSQLSYIATIQFSSSIPMSMIFFDVVTSVPLTDGTLSISFILVKESMSNSNNALTTLPAIIYYPPPHIFKIATGVPFTQTNNQVCVDPFNPAIASFNVIIYTTITGLSVSLTNMQIANKSLCSSPPQSDMSLDIQRNIMMISLSDLTAINNVSGIVPITYSPNNWMLVVRLDTPSIINSVSFDLQAKDPCTMGMIVGLIDKWPNDPFAANSPFPLSISTEPMGATVVCSSNKISVPIYFCDNTQYATHLLIVPNNSTVATTVIISNLQINYYNCAFEYCSVM